MGMPDKQQEQIGFMARLYRALGPIAGGLMLDFVDLATLGPIGLFLGPFLGFAAAMWICSIYRFSLRTKIWLSLLAGLYCMVPMTEPFPLATITMAFCRFFEGPPPPTPENNHPKPTSPERKTVESTTIK